MCGIFGIISNSAADMNRLGTIARYSQQRGMDSSGLVIYDGVKYHIYRSDYAITKLLGEIKLGQNSLVLGHSRLITNGLTDNQPVVKDGVCVLHNGIIVNHESIWGVLKKKRALEIDTEVIAAIAAEHIEDGFSLELLPQRILELCRGVVACAIALPALGKVCLFSNNGSLYGGISGDSFVFSSESFPLSKIGCSGINQIKDAVFINIPISRNPFEISENKTRKINLIPGLLLSSAEENLLEHRDVNLLRRCTKCLLPETMPFIHFDSNGVCNYCLNYKPRNIPKPKEELFQLVEPYRRTHKNDCIVPFSGGRDSSYALHLVVNELKMKPVAYTYDWGMITDLGRRNISLMCASLGVENIIVANDIANKRKYIAMNLRAWLKSPHLGMISILTAGDKHFFRHIETIKQQTGIGLNLWGINPLEVTYFKSGFLGVPPDFEEKRVYSHGALKQLRYQYLRFRAMLSSAGYFNRSLWDTISGEYYRSFTTKSDYYHLFDYWKWDEKLIENTLDQYGWERAVDTKTTWRIGDGTVAFYNYIYYLVAGFTEHDTFRSNQIREGEITREDALKLVKEENMPRYANIKWYLDTLGMDFREVISLINNIPKMY